MDGQNFIFTPLWVRIIALSVLSATLILSLIVAWYYLETDQEDWILVSMSVAQVSASGLVVALLVFFSARDIGSIGVQVKTDQFLTKTLPKILLFLDYPMADEVAWTEKSVAVRHIKKAAKKSPTQIYVRHVEGSNSAFYRLVTRSTSLVIHIQVNVSELTVSYYFPLQSSDQLQELKNELAWAISRYTDIGGYKESWYFSRESFDGQFYGSVHLTRRFPADFLDDERQKMEFAQDVTSSTRSLIKDSVARGLKLSY